jgi:DNA polymerase-3 subunit alpha
MSMKDGDYHLINTEEAIELFKGIPGAVENTAMVAEMCDLDLVLGKFVFPEFALPEGVTTDAELKRLALLGMKKRGLHEDPKAIERLEYELSVIAMKGYAAYFLVVEDLIRFAHENKILTNIRGSVAGSMTTYALGITSVDPLAYKLPFERFLNPDRPSAPDIDMDFADNRRDEVIEYAKQKYGADKVAQIGTFGTMMARGAVRDVARALGYPYDIGDRLSKMIPMGSQGMPMTIEHAMELEPELKKAYDNEPDTKKIIDLAKKIEGGVRHISVHAAGVVISPRPLVEYVPLQFDPKGGKLITQYDMYTVGEDGVGLTKFDFLGIRNLSILAEAVTLVEQRHGVQIDLENIPLDDPRTFALLARGQTEGLFQLNGSGMTRYLKELKPSTIHDINAMVALYRPGPMEAIPEYIKRKHNPALIRYIDPRMKDILDASFGVITYQDDVMMIAIKLAGYTWIEADKLRKAMGKKIPAEMEAQKEKLIMGFIKNGLTKDKANDLWLLIEPFAAYGFNKAHAASYGRVSYQTAFMKANYPVEYMTAIMTAESGDVEKVADIIAECKNMGITVLPPDTNESFGGFTVITSGDNNGTGGVIRFGLYTIKNLGTDISDDIIEERRVRGPFKTIGDFLDRIHHKNLNKKSLEALIKVGAMDFCGKRETLFGNIENMLEYNREGKKNAGMVSLFGDLPDAGSSFVLRDMPPISKEEILVWEKELLGLYVSGHPLDKIKDKLMGRAINIKKVHAELQNGLTVALAGIIETVRAVFTKNNERMAFIKISDFHGSIEAVIFPKLYREVAELIVQDKTIAFEGKITVRNGEKSIAIEKIREI